jgi:hypothetical protein
MSQPNLVNEQKKERLTAPVVVEEFKNLRACLCCGLIKTFEMVRKLCLRKINFMLFISLLNTNALLFSIQLRANTLNL